MKKSININPRGVYLLNKSLSNRENKIKSLLNEVSRIENLVLSIDNKIKLIKSNY